MPDTHIFLGNYGPLAGREEEFESLWATHVSEAVNLIDGFVAGQRYRVNPRQREWSPPPQWDRLMIYELEGDDVEAIHRDNTRVREQDLYTPFTHLVDPDHMGHVYSPVGTPCASDGWGGREEATHIVVVRSNPGDGLDAEYNDWYDLHIREVVDVIDGYRGARRYRLNASQRPGMRAAPWEYVTIYELDDTPLDEVYASNSIAKRNRETVFTLREGILKDDHIGHVFTKVGERIVDESRARA